jgi:hypothetical protein
MGKGGSSTQSSTATETQNVDRRITSESGSILSLGESQVTVNSGGEVRIISNDPGSALAALEAMQRNSEDFLSASTKLAAGSNEIARQVAESQEQFVATATGQKYALWGIAVIGGAFVLIALPRFFKK